MHYVLEFLLGNWFSEQICPAIIVKYAHVSKAFIERPVGVAAGVGNEATFRL